MTDKEFKRLNRPQLIEIIYRLQLKLEEMTAENERLAGELADKRLRIDKAGNLAEAALEVHHVMQAAQDAASHYVEEMKLRADEEYQQILQGARDEAARILGKANRKAAKKRARSEKHG